MSDPPSKKELEKERKILEEKRKELEEKWTQLQRFQAQVTQEQQQWAAERQSQREASNVAPRETRQTIYTSRIGKMKEFNLQEEWALWAERLEQYFIANDIPEAKKVSLFLTLLGSEGYALLSSLCTPVKPATKTFAELTTLIKNHLQPKPSIITERYKFKECKQKNGEDIKTYLANLKKLSANCEFGQNLNSHLRDQFVWGLRTDSIKKRLLGESDLTFARAMELAQSLEMASRDVAEMGSTSSKSPQDSINFVGARNSRLTSEKEVNKGILRCYHCGGTRHTFSTCKFKDSSCNKCHKKGHLARVCNQNKNKEIKSRSGNKQKLEDNNQNYIDDFESDNDSFDNLFHLGQGNKAEKQTFDEILSMRPCEVEIEVGKTKINFQLDTGSDVAVISEKDYRKNKNLLLLSLKSTKRCFKSHPGDIIVPKGVLSVKVKFREIERKLELFVLPGEGPPLVGRTWIRELALPVTEIINGGDNSNIDWLSNSNRNDIDNIIKEFAPVFAEKLGKYSKKEIQLHLKENANQIFCKPRALPYALKDKVEKELDRLVKEEILEPVENSEWATPIVPVLKNNGQLRLCGDYKITVNPNIKIDRYPIPRVQDLLSSLNGGKIFSKIDLSQAYQQLVLDERSRKLVTISTHKGLFAYKRLCYGVSSAPGIFQREMEQLLKNLDGVICFFDDILITGQTKEIHNERLKEVLKRLNENGLTLKKEKCKFGKNSVEFLGYVLDSEGTHVSKGRVKAVVEAPVPTNLMELRAFLEMMNYYAKFIKNYARIVNPLYHLLQKNVKWNWNDDCEAAFGAAKRSLTESNVLVHYNPELPIKLTCDASPVGLGAVLSHVFPNGVERPIAFASRSLSKAERNYSQLDKEALSLIFGVKKFHQFIYGRAFTLETDHKPLVYIFGSKRGLPQMSANRVQRWAVFLSAYEFEIKYIKGIDNAKADSLSRLPLPLKSMEGLENSPSEYSYLHYVAENMGIIDHKLVCKKTESDRTLNKVKNFVCNGWPEKVDESLRKYKAKENELTVENGCLMWGYRVIIPEDLRKNLLKELHDSHLGVVKMKSVARSYIWWPGIDNEIENVVKSCEWCLEAADNPPKAALHSWKWPDGPNIRLHADFLGPIDGKMFIVIVDAFSKWLDVKEMRNITTDTTIKALKEYFSTWGIPMSVVTDNGPSFCSSDFENFLTEYGVRHIRTAPYHPASNGAAENAVRTFKKKFKILIKEGNTSHQALCKFLFSYRATPHCTTEYSPAELQIGRKFRTKLDLIKPTLRSTVEKNQYNQQRFHRGNRKTEFVRDEIVMVKDAFKNKWLKSRIIDRLSPVTYSVETSEGKKGKRHADQLLACKPEYREGNSKSTEGSPLTVSTHETCQSKSNNEISEEIENNEENQGGNIKVESESKPRYVDLCIPRRSTRVPKPRKILDL
ncbi:uncharacterized protein K02A2.6-like [Venturia canescens]|uniref:uncharacterized protein K02A2.6-like n=1 Tax=Venturia canescens TaxID=32260 RepID=UPI001C9C40AB|nr:uncharacterized protein K02A2.6-like [Venturia canescens]XP_043266602.1 uncharacterized protein K02A2.6-like [Venturia canescens]XP_043266604.1 uncharacterized protein K02A2.6-like [Venturia canescens]XP_043266605.1 uncharacterized protein K02A2.6-like [Venturia canescens]XP_043266606.1 uncharacterized protein K02A2.6-like [Venturia canescens]XP_043266607.1 uncharacterized protein K02A2.6-like [Venturia canescens]XP_043266608.1 uncharacterized protein K02A2.6-like [Venturia canescens]